MTKLHRTTLMYVIVLWIISIFFITYGGFDLGLFKSEQLRKGLINFNYPYFEVIETSLYSLVEMTILFFILRSKNIISLWKILIASLIFGFISLIEYFDAAGYMVYHQTWLKLVTISLIFWIVIRLIKYMRIKTL